MFRQATTFSWLNKIGKIYPKYCKIKSSADRTKWCRLIRAIHTRHGYGAIFVAWMFTTGLRKEHCFIWIRPTQLTNTIALYVRKNVAFYGPIFASYTSVPQERCRSVLKHVFKRCSREMLRLLRMIAEKSQKRLGPWQRRLKNKISSNPLLNYYRW